MSLRRECGTQKARLPPHGDGPLRPRHQQLPVSREGRTWRKGLLRPEPAAGGTARVQVLAELRPRGWRPVSQGSQEARGPCTWPLLSTLWQHPHG